jgi:hypothetical protein
MQRTAIAILALLVLAPAGRAEDAYYSLRLSGLTITAGELPRRDGLPLDARELRRSRALRPYVVLDAPGEAFVINNDPVRPANWPLCVRAEGGTDVTGRLFLPKADWNGMVAVKFRIAASAANASARDLFHAAKVAHYQTLIEENAPGAAWFRHQVRRTLEAAGPAAAERIARLQPARADELLTTFSPFSTGRAASERIRLDRLLPPAANGTDRVDVNAIPGISDQNVDWSKLAADLAPELDPLAKLIPADQHAAFFSSVQSLARVLDELDVHGQFLLSFLGPRSEDSHLRARYERQLCLSLQDAERILRAEKVRSVALTGSDGDFIAGTDVAILLETDQPDRVEAVLLDQIAKNIAGNTQVERSTAEIDGLRYQGFRSSDRTVACYIAQLDGACVVANSPHQIQRLAGVRRGAPPLDKLPEFKYFRHRYRRGEDREAALLFAGNAAIRRWCGPRWRIASSRRQRDLAVMADLQAAHLTQYVNQDLPARPLHTDFPLAAAGELSLGPGGVRSSQLGSLALLSPVAEMPLANVTRAEANAYEEWRTNFEGTWRWALSPTAIRATIDDDSLAADVSVLPLNLRSDFRNVVSVAQGAKIKPAAGDPHDDVLHVVMSVNTESPLVQAANNFIMTMAPEVRRGPIGWIGQAIALYADDDPSWDAMAKVDPELWDSDFPGQAAKLPLALWVEVTNAVTANAFLTAARARQTEWVVRNYKGQSYSRMTPHQRGRGRTGEAQDLSIYYVVIDDALVLSFNETVIQRAIDRQLRRRQETAPKPAESQAERPWLGSNLALKVDRKLIQLASAVTRRDYQHAMQALAWRSLPVLNEWKRLYPDRNPVEVHEHVWKVRLVCPGGGDYVWNDEWQTMESTVYGHPGAPKEGPAAAPALARLLRAEIGVTLEDDGARARAVLIREPRLNVAQNPQRQDDGVRATAVFSDDTRPITNE